MKLKIIIINIFIVFLASCSIFTWADFKDYFDDGISPLWNPVGGLWEPLDGAYHAKDFGRAGVYSLLPFETTDGITIKVRAMENLSPGFQNMIIVFAYVNEDEVYFAGGFIIASNWGFRRSGRNGWNNPGWIDLARTNAGILSKRWYSMELEIEKTTVILSVDDKFKVEHKFKKLPKGRIGLSVHGGDTLFDDLEVLGVDYRPVSPKSALATTWAKMKGR